MEGGKPENPEKNPQSKARTNNKLNPHETASTGIELESQRWEASAYPLRSSPLIVVDALFPVICRDAFCLFVYVFMVEVYVT